MTFQVGKQSPDYNKIFGIIAGVCTIFGTLGFTVLVILAMQRPLDNTMFQLVWLTVGCMVGGLIMVKVYQRKGGHED